MDLSPRFAVLCGGSPGKLACIVLNTHVHIHMKDIYAYVILYIRVCLQIYMNCAYNKYIIFFKF